MISTTTSIGQKIQVWGYPGMELDLGGVTHTLSEKEFLDFCRRHPDARVERDCDGEIILMAPAYTETGGMNSNLSSLLWLWSRENGTGMAFESSTGFTLPNRALRSPDASWISNDHWNALSDHERAGFAQICPDFVAELRSSTDNLRKLRDKMDEYIANGSSLGWLIDPIAKRVYIYRPDSAIEVLENPDVIIGDPVLSGFTLNLREVWG